MREWFSIFASKLAGILGSTVTILIAAGLVLASLVIGSRLGFSDKWVVTVNTSISMITFIMVFLIQNGQNRNAKAMHLKINELIRGIEGPRTDMVNVEQRTDEEMRELDQQFTKVAQEASQTVVEVATEAAQKIEDAPPQAGKNKK